MNPGETVNNEQDDKRELEIFGMKYEVTTDDNGQIDSVVKRVKEEDDAVMVSGVSKRHLCEEMHNSLPAASIPKEQYDLTKFKYTVHGEDNGFNPKKDGVAEFYLDGEIMGKVLFHEGGYFEKVTPKSENLQSTLEFDNEETLLGKNLAELK